MAYLGSDIERLAAAAVPERLRRVWERDRERQFHDVARFVDDGRRIA